MNKANYKKNIVIGAGIAGLSFAYKLKNSQEDFWIFEKEAQARGTWQSHKYKSSIFEFGPNTIIDKSDALREMIKSAGLEEEVLSSSLKESKRYFYRNNQLIEISSNPFKLIASKILSLKAKLRILFEPFVKSKSTDKESVYDFFARRFGKECAENIMGPALQGVWGGDIKQLNMSVTLSHLYQLEQKYSSVIKGLIFSKKERKKSKRLQTISFRNGLEDLCTKLAGYLGNLKLNSELLSIEKEDGLYKLKIREGNNQEFYYCTNLILACPAFAAGRLVESINLNLAKALMNIFYAPIFLIAYSIKKDLDKNHQDIFDAFGFLNATKAHFTLGTIFASSLYKERALDDEHLMVGFIGGSKNSQIADFDTKDLTAIALNEAKEIFDNALEINTELEDFIVINTKLIKQAIPQYNDNYLIAKNIIDQELEKDSSLILVGNYMNGVSIVDTIEHIHKLDI